jgi:hypothetical protein
MESKDLKSTNLLGQILVSKCGSVVSTGGSNFSGFLDLGTSKSHKYGTTISL